jgi:D-apionolactonase
MNRSIGLFGTAEPPADDQLVACGRLSLRIRGGELRRIAFDGAEAVRSIAFVIRDRDWGTLALRPHRRTSI